MKKFLFKHKHGFYQFCVNYASDFIVQAITEVAVSQGVSLDNDQATHFIMFLHEAAKRLPLPKDQRTTISSECKHLLKEYKELYLD